MSWTTRRPQNKPKKPSDRFASGWQPSALEAVAGKESRAGPGVGFGWIEVCFQPQKQIGMFVDLTGFDLWRLVAGFGFTSSQLRREIGIHLMFILGLDHKT